jgi:hypothetical protein
MAEAKGRTEMNRRPRNLTPHLEAEWQRQFPDETPKITRGMKVLAAFLMRQIDRTGTAPIIEPSVYLEGAEPGPNVRPKKRGAPPE